MLNPKMSYLQYLKVNSKTLISFCISLWFLLVFAMEISLTWSKTKKKKDLHHLGTTCNQNFIISVLSPPVIWIPLPGAYSGLNSRIATERGFLPLGWAGWFTILSTNGNDWKRSWAQLCISLVVFVVLFKVATES